ncbi:YARHG domain-containing protein [Clostridium sp. SHJSY1]|uniref:YARHG domain-containing protein n=1 Tax=Clostridium sp. SHJSY1 TaxID=2942483 RepID=UPI002875C903|nr:YARHG domain-containing protein [Clostridium sp. SHJSY1]MDS0525938.1 YARHG domain-containing protein [Clostridium sp. SHJSY1]
MKLLKKFLTIICSLILMLSLFGCDKSSSSQDTAQSESSTDSTSKDDKDTTSNDYIFPDSDRVLLTEDKLTDLPLKTLELGRNEIFARHGYVFKTDELKKYFTEKSWYKENPNFKSENDLTGTETKNIALIKSIEDKKINGDNKTINKKVAGKTYGKIKQVTLENGTKYISFDKVEWLVYDDIKNRQDVKDYLVKQYGSLPTEFENDYYIYDPDANLTKLPLSNNATITNWKSDNSGISTYSISFDDLKNNTKQNEMLPQDGIYSITIENNAITKLEKMYQP